MTVRQALMVGVVAGGLVVPALVGIPSAAAEPARKYIVLMQDGGDPMKAASSARAKTDRVYTEAVDGFSAMLTDSDVKRLRTTDGVTAVTLNRVLFRRDPRGPRYEVPEQPEQFVTSEIRRVGATESRTARIDGRGRGLDVDIAVLDGGVDPFHPDLRVVGGFDCVDRPGSPDFGFYDRDGHGTFVAGQAAAIDNEIGVVGVAPGARIWSVRVTNPSGFVTEEALLCGLEWLKRNSRRIEVANMSFGGENPTPAIDTCGRERISRRFPLLRVVDPFHSARF